MARLIIMCKGCNEKVELHGNGMCYKCYKKNYKPLKIICKKCKRYIGHHAKGYCGGCYNTLFRLESNKLWNKKNILKRREYLRKGYKKKYGKDLRYTMKRRLRRHLLYAIKTYTKIGKIMSSKRYEINYQAIIEHLKPFPEDITKYHIDHIKPLSKFDLTNLREIKLAFNPRNHQWLLIKDNLSKGNKLEVQSNLF